MMGQQAGDRRLLVLAEELPSVLHTMGRSRSHLSPLLRCAWDSGTLRMLDRDTKLTQEEAEEPEEFWEEPT
jgi:hypothetical protein